MADPLEAERRANDQLRYAVVESIEGDRCIVRVGDLLSGPIPWFCFRAGQTVILSRPSIGEQGLLVCPEGELQAGLFLPGVASSAFPLPAANEDEELIVFKDGCTISYNPATHHLNIAPPAGGTVQIVADVDIQGDLDCSGDVRIPGVSLRGHLHEGVQPGGGLSGGPA